MKKRTKIVMLPTDKAVEIGSICLHKDFGLGQHCSMEKSYDGSVRQELYFINDEEPKVGNWVIEFIISDPYKTIQVQNEDLERCIRNWKGKSCKKIIATTDTQLMVQGSTPEGSKEWKSVFELPQPSQSFIEEYCRKGGVDEVDVEGELFWEVNGVVLHEYLEPLNPQKDDKQVFIPKVDSNNCIIIHPIDMKTLEELLRQAFELGQQWVQDMNNDKQPTDFNGYIPTN